MRVRMHVNANHDNFLSSKSLMMFVRNHFLSLNIYYRVCSLLLFNSPQSQIIQYRKTILFFAFVSNNSSKTIDHASCHEKGQGDLIQKHLLHFIFRNSTHLNYRETFNYNHNPNKSGLLVSTSTVKRISCHHYPKSV